MSLWVVGIPLFDGHSSFGSFGDGLNLVVRLKNIQ
jgi:hypothetical protein